MNKVKITWKCNYCKDTVTSDSTQRHKMDYCKCKKSAIDLEEHYLRQVGDIEIIKGEE